MPQNLNRPPIDQQQPPSFEVIYATTLDGGIGTINNTLAEENIPLYTDAVRESSTPDIDKDADECVDGRFCRCDKSNGEYKTRYHVAGGGATTTYASRVILGTSELNEESFKQVISLAADRKFGGHARDCGAAQNLPKILKYYRDNIDKVTAIRKTLLDQEGIVCAKRFPLEFEAPTSWNGAALIDNGLSAINLRRVQELDNGVGPDGSTAANHGHQEVGFIFDYRDSETIDQNVLHEIGGQREVNMDSFVVDMNRLKELADMESGKDRGSDPWLDTYVAMVDFQIATGLTLTKDKKGVVIVRTQGEQHEDF